MSPTGADASAKALLEHATTTVLPKAVGACKLTYALAPKGGVLSEFSLMRLPAFSSLAPGGGAGGGWYLVGSRDHSAFDAQQVLASDANPQEQRYHH